MKSLEERAHINTDDIPFLQDVIARNTVDNAVIDGNTGTCGEAVIVQERRFSTLSHDKIVDGLVNFLGRYAGSYHFPCQSTGCRGNSTGTAHGLKFTFIFDCDHTLAPIALRISSLAPSMD